MEVVEIAAKIIMTFAILVRWLPILKDHTETDFERSIDNSFLNAFIFDTLRTMGITKKAIKLKVRKRDGKLENYDSAKIKKVVIAAGLNEKEAKALCLNLDTWAKSVRKKEVSSLEIKDIVALELKKVNNYAYEKYMWWEKYKDQHLA